ncbi:MAG: sulfotransferase [Ilumatobacter sp.]
MTALPTFIGIGAQKSGTTWLHEQLDAHPDVWVPPTKELHFFDGAHGSAVVRSLIARDADADLARRRLRGVFSGPGRRHNATMLLAPRSRRRYERCFEPDEGQRAGEITPAYALLDDRTVARISRWIPDLRVLFMLRSPVQRAWSHFNMFRQRHHRDTGFAFSDLPAVKLATIISKSTYLPTVDRWETAFRSGALRILFYDDLEIDPTAVLVEALDHIGARSDAGVITPTVNERVHARHPGPIDPETEWVLTSRLFDEIQRLHQRFENASTQRWADRAIDVMRRQR